MVRGKGKVPAHLLVGVAAVKEVRDSPLIGRRVRLRLEFETGDVEAPPATIIKVYDAAGYQRGTDQFCLLRYEPPADIERVVKRSLFGSKVETRQVDYLFFRVLQGKLENLPRDTEGNVTRVPYRANLEKLLLNEEPRLREVKGFVGLTKDPTVFGKNEFDDIRDLVPFAAAVALRP